MPRFVSKASMPVARRSLMRSTPGGAARDGIAARWVRYVLAWPQSSPLLPCFSFPRTLHWIGNSLSGRRTESPIYSSRAALAQMSSTSTGRSTKQRAMHFPKFCVIKSKPNNWDVVLVGWDLGACLFSYRDTRGYTTGVVRTRNVLEILLALHLKAGRKLTCGNRWSRAA